MLLLLYPNITSDHAESEGRRVFFQESNEKVSILFLKEVAKEIKGVRVLTALSNGGVRHNSRPTHVSHGSIYNLCYA